MKAAVLRHCLQREARRRSSWRVVDTRLDEGTDGDPVSVLVVEPA